MTRAPVFRTSGIVQTQSFLRWIQDHYDDVRRVTEASSRHLKLIEVRPFAFGTTVFLRFRFDSGDAMGMNMATIACDRVVTDLIEPATGVACIGLSGNYCVTRSRPTSTPGGPHLRRDPARGPSSHIRKTRPAASSRCSTARTSK